VPTEQAIQRAAAAAAAYDPGEHKAHAVEDVAPVDATALPGAQLAQLVAPTID
jgi:hypothetical protein